MDLIILFTIALAVAMLPGSSADAGIYYPSICQVGDAKHGYQASEHAGWVPADGRAISTLTTGQAANAMQLGMTSNLPNLGDIAIVGTSAAKPLGSFGGSANTVLTANHLPATTMTSSTASSGTPTGTVSVSIPNGGAHQHTYLIPSTVGNFASGSGSALISGGSSQITDIGGSHSHTATATFTGTPLGKHTHVSSFGLANPTPIVTQSPYVALNSFVCLGN